ncbi:hypothetical protein QJS66_10195 [Kocuria rhizophila]|nr:hypothetical protein QJS66_10195 [Kocuria rhizophila]
MVLTAAISGVNATLYACVRAAAEPRGPRPGRSREVPAGVPAEPCCASSSSTCSVAYLSVYALGRGRVRSGAGAYCRVRALRWYLDLRVSTSAARRRARHLHRRGVARRARFADAAPVTNYVYLTFLVVLSLYVMTQQPALVLRPAGRCAHHRRRPGCEFSKRHVAKKGLPELKTTGEDDDHVAAEPGENEVAGGVVPAVARAGAAAHGTRAFGRRVAPGPAGAGPRGAT